MLNLVYLLLLQLWQIPDCGNINNEVKLQSDSLDTMKLHFVEHEWNAAIYNKDTAKLRNMLHPEFWLVQNNQRMSKSDVLRIVADPAYVILPYECNNVQVRILGNTAVLTGFFTQVLLYHRSEFKYSVTYTDVYCKQGGIWFPFSAHAYFLPK